MVPAARAGRRAATLRLQGLEIEREGLSGRRERRGPVPAAERRQVGPVVGVGPFGGRRVVRHGEVMLDGSRELGKNGSAAFERLDRG